MFLLCPVPSSVTRFTFPQVNANIKVNNSSRKQVKNIKAQIVQHCEVTMVNKHFTRVVAEVETREGCPITPGASLSKVFHLTPMAKNSMDRGVALDGQLKVQRAPDGHCRRGWWTRDQHFLFCFATILKIMETYRAGIFCTPLH